jgi:hypothetical protein
MGVFGSNPEGTGGPGRHSALSSSRRLPVFASSSALIGGPCHPFAFASIALTGPDAIERALRRALPFLATTAAADPPYTPSSDSVVLERVAVPRLPGTATLSELRESWAVQPKSVPAALAYARAGVELNRREEDPRYLGYAEAALRPGGTGLTRRPK